VTDTTSLPLFLGSVIAISLTGVMMPGPVTAVTVSKGSQRKEAGALIAIGHGLIEIPLILLIYFGLAHFLTLTEVKISVGLAGGLVLIWMALNMVKNRPSVFSEQKELAHSSVVAGLATTAANPYFFIWWATVGAALLVSARDFGGAGVAAMGVTHWLCDFAWLYLVSWAVFKSRPLWTRKVNTVVFGVCSAILAGFGAWFIFSSIDLAIST
jgi:threonine/homoserine/homoserine lactone efflux protein